MSFILPFQITVTFAEQTAPKTSEDIYGWIEETPYSNAESGIYDTVNIVSDDTYGKAVEFIKQSDKNTKNRLAIYQNISPSKLITGHTYTLEFAYNVPETTDKFWISGGFSTWDNKKRAQPMSLNVKGQGWKTTSVSMEYNISNFPNSGNLGSIIPVYLLVQEVARFKIANVILYDNADTNKTNLLINGSFVETVDYTNYLHAWEIYNSKKMVDEETGQVLDEVSFIPEDDIYTNIVKISKKSEKLPNSFLGINQTIPQEKLISGHTYVYELDMRLTDKTSGTVRISPINVEQSVGWSHNTWEYEYKSGDMWVAFRCIDNPIDMYLANINIYDKADENKTNLLENGDFSGLPESDIKFEENAEGVVAKIISKKENYDILMSYAIYKGGNLVETQVNTQKVKVSNEVQEFTMYPDIMGDGYTTKAFLWRADNMKPLANAIEIE